MEEQTPFCPSCGAPQIRVSVRTAAQDPAEPDSLSTPPPPLDSASARLPAMPGGLGPSQPVLWKKFFRIVLPMAVVVGASSAAMLPVGLLIFLPASVVLAIHVYRRRQQPGPITSSLGARLGVFTGLLGFAVFLIVFVLAVTSHKTEYREVIIKGLNDAAASNAAPQIQQKMRAFFSGTAGILVFTAFFLGVTLIFFLIISSLTGALAAATSRGKKPL